MSHRTHLKKLLRPTWSLARLSCVLLAVLGTSASAAQLKLPGKPREDAPSGGSIAPYRVCSVCSARNYTNVPSGRQDAQGRELAWCDTCKRDTPQAYSTATNSGPGIPEAAGNGQLKLPRAVPGVPEPAAPVPAKPVEGAQAPPKHGPAPAPDAQGGMTPAAAFVFAEVAKLPSSEEGTAQRAVESLLALREDGLAACRIALFDEKSVPIVVAARTLLRGGVPADADLVVRRLRAKLPTGAGAPLLRAVVEEDPVRATPELFASLLDHTQAALRNAASRELGTRLTESTLPLLDPALASTRTETRALALELAARLPGPRATADLLARLEDANARVASAAVTALRVRDDAGLDTELLRRTFQQRWILRPNAYALLAILEREDAQLRPILLDEHVEPLLESLTSNDPFLSGTCAAALAGLGFRSARSDVSQWLDGQVPDRLVLAVSGKVFHEDHSSLIGPAVRRLRLLSGETFGPDGPAWVDWWVRSRVGFKARRAALTIQPGEEGAIRLSAFAPDHDAGVDLDVELVGPDAVTRTSARREEIRLTASQAAEVSAALTREGVLAAERMPGAYQSEGRDDRTLEIEVRGRAKAFVAGPRAKEPWFEKLLSLAAALRERNRWQLLVAAPVAGGERAAWDAEAAWWSAEQTEPERLARLDGLALGALRGSTAPRRDRALDELERARASGRLSPDAFPELLLALRREPNPGERAQRLTALAIHAGCAGAERLPSATAQRMLDGIEEGFAAGGNDLVALVLGASERTFVRRLAVDDSLALRRAATEVLGHAPDEEDARVLMKLLNDPDARVHTAAAEALGSAKVEIARDDLLSRARLGRGTMRRAALRAAGSLGGPNVLDALVLGLADADADVRLAAVEGLGRLRAPTAAQVLVNLLSETGDAPVRDASRAALARIGEPALPALRRAAETPNGKARREAALVLAQLGSPDAAPPLLAIVSQDREDKLAANELAVLSCFDPRGTSAEPANAWWTWWDGVRHDDALVWFRAGVERLGIPQPPAGALEGAGTLEGQRFLLTLLDREETWLPERAWRELARLAREDLGELPPRGSLRSKWVRERRAGLAAREAAGGTRR
ncbi:MAG: HEAT repeat domain-containing protein [Planctomycetota bacterium]|nr:HEAT repeat domain-containing protein [Planctomycetota bacterium]